MIETTFEQGNLDFEPVLLLILRKLFKRWLDVIVQDCPRDRRPVSSGFRNRPMRKDVRMIAGGAGN